jgi:hypothetical protein
MKKCPLIRTDDSCKIDKLEDLETECVTLAANMRKWNLHTLVNTLNELKSDIPGEIKIYLYQYP